MNRCVDCGTIYEELKDYCYATKYCYNRIECMQCIRGFPDKFPCDECQTTLDDFEDVPRPRSGRRRRRKGKPRGK